MNASRCTQFIHLQCSSEYCNKILVVLASIDIIWHLRAQQRAWEYKLRTQCTSMWAWPNYLCPNCWLKPRSMRICSILLKLAIKFRRKVFSFTISLFSPVTLDFTAFRSMKLWVLSNSCRVTLWLLLGVFPPKFLEVVGPTNCTSSFSWKHDWVVHTWEVAGNTQTLPSVIEFVWTDCTHCTHMGTLNFTLVPARTQQPRNFYFLSILVPSFCLNLILK